MFVMAEAELLPTKPAKAVHSRYGHSGRMGLAGSSSVPMVNINSTTAKIWSSYARRTLRW